MKKKLLAIMMFLSVSLSVHAEIPGMKGPDHIGITVPDLKQAVSFFVNILGCKAFYHLGPFSDKNENWMSDNLDVHPRAEIPVMQLVRCGNGSNLEIFEYVSPDQDKRLPRNSDIGGHHIAFYVEDMDAAVRYLETNGIQVLGGVKTMTTGPSSGESWIYFKAPWGMQLELVSYENGKAYEKTYSRQLFSPRKYAQQDI